MKKKIIAIAILLFIGVNTYSQNKIDLRKVKAQSYWCYNKVDGKSVWVEKIDLIYDNDSRQTLTKDGIISIQNQLINKGYKIDSTGIIDDKTVSSIHEFQAFQEYNSKENIRERNIQERNEREKNERKRKRLNKKGRNN